MVSKETGTGNRSNLLLPASGVAQSNCSIQRKLSIGAVNDPMEHEADAMADKVMRMPEPNVIHRKCSHCEEEKAQRKPLASFIQKKELSDSHFVASDTVSSQIQSTKGSGNSMPETTKSFMESRFGADFSNVKIHTGDRASALSGQLNAQAFTVGKDVYFNKEKYQPESFEGRHLLAHELTHVVQQGGANELSPDIKRKVIWKDITKIPPDYLLIFDVDDGDFVGGCVKQIVPHGGIKLIQSGGPMLFNIHFGIFKNKLGEYCMFFYESVGGTCLTECFEDLAEAIKRLGEWVKEKAKEFLDALEGVARILVYAIQLALIAAILAMMVILAGMVLAVA